MRSRSPLLPVAALAAAAACGGGGAAPSEAAPPGAQPPASLEVTPAQASLLEGETVTLSAVALNDAGSPVAGLPAPTWTSDAPEVAAVDADGRVTAASPGNAAVTATLAHGGVTRSASAAITVEPPPAAPVASFVLSPASATLAPGETVRLVAEARDAEGAPVAGLPEPSWSSSDPSRATVAGGGTVTAVAAGTATITATLRHGGTTHAATALVAVAAPPAPPAPSTASVAGDDRRFVPDSVTIAVGGTVTWTMTKGDHDVTFVGAAPPGGSIPEVEEDASASRAFPEPGTYRYRCAKHADDGMTGVVVVVASQGGGTLDRLVLSPATLSVGVGQARQVAATALDEAGLPIGGAPAPSWSSADVAVARVAADGTVTGVAVGSTTVTATLTLDGVTRSAEAAVTVTDAPSAPTSATVRTPNRTFSPPTVTIAAGGTVTWSFSEDTHNVTFSGSAPAGGNVPDQDAGTSATRTFAAPGTYDYACTRHGGMTGRVVVQ